jgi:hypothetical protein
MINYEKGLDELKEFIEELPLGNKMKMELAEIVCRELSSAFDIGRFKGFQDAINVNRPDISEVMNQVADELHQKIKNEIQGIKPSQN